VAGEPLIDFVLVGELSRHAGRRLARLTSAATGTSWHSINRTG
jgi:hypothetical protein